MTEGRKERREVVSRFDNPPPLCFKWRGDRGEEFQTERRGKKRGERGLACVSSAFLTSQREVPGITG